VGIAEHRSEWWWHGKGQRRWGTRWRWQATRFRSSTHELGMKERQLQQGGCCSGCHTVSPQADAGHRLGVAQSRDRQWPAYQPSAGAHVGVCRDASCSPGFEPSDWTAPDHIGFYNRGLPDWESVTAQQTGASNASTFCTIWLAELLGGTGDPPP